MGILLVAVFYALGAGIAVGIAGKFVPCKVALGMIVMSGMLFAILMIFRYSLKV